jgi:hypothetical protein
MRTILAVSLAIWLGIQSLVMITSKATAAPQIVSKAAAAADAGNFRFISWGDAQDEDGNLSKTANQASTLDPAFTIFNGDLENEGVTTDRMNAMLAAFGSVSSKTFLTRGNHDDHVSGSAGLWENYFTDLNRALPAGVTNYTALNSSSTYLTYSFDYGNSRFIGVDVPGDADLLTSSQFTFLDSRLTDAENSGLVHAFIFFHGPEYCIESTHCNCSAKNDGSCTPSQFVTLINKHPIVSATFHGHEHILGWVHMDNTRVAGLTHSYEEIMTSPSGGWTYNSYVYPARMDYYYPNMGTSQGFAAIDVNGDSFTVSFYKTGTTAAVWSHSYSKTGVVPTTVPVSTSTSTPVPSTSTPVSTSTPLPATSTPLSTATFTPTKPGVGEPMHYFYYFPVINNDLPPVGVTPVPTNTPRYRSTRTPAPTRTRTTNPGTPAVTGTPAKTSTPAPTRTITKTPTTGPTVTPGSGSRPLNYYLVDRVLNNADYAKLGAWGVNTAVVAMGINDTSRWSSIITAAANAGIKIVIWPDQGGDVSGCGWETPFNSPQNGDYIWRIKTMLDTLGGNPNVIGIVTAHEAMWNQGTCRTLIADMAAVKTQIKSYILTKFGRTDFKVWNYIDNISDVSSVDDYSGPADYAKIMDVAVTWQHCAGNAESACDTGSYSSLSKINDDRKKLDAAGGGVELVFIQDTFTMGGTYGTKFTLSQLENYSCEFLNTSALDGFGFYTWDAGWWGDLHSWTDLQPAVPYIYDTCTVHAP